MNKKQPKFGVSQWRKFLAHLHEKGMKDFTLKYATLWFENEYKTGMSYPVLSARVYIQVLYPMMKKNVITRKARGFFTLATSEYLDSSDELDEFDLYLLSKMKPSKNMLEEE